MVIVGHMVCDENNECKFEVKCISRQSLRKLSPQKNN